MNSITAPVQRLQALGFRFLAVTPGAKTPLPGWGVDSAVTDANVPHRTGWYGVVCPVGYVVLDFDRKAGRGLLVEVKSKANRGGKARGAKQAETLAIQQAWRERHPGVCVVAYSVKDVEEAFRR